MSDADWDAEDYEPPKATSVVTPRVADRWDGEDEDDDVKDSWDKESDEEDDSKGSEDSVKAVQRKKKKKLGDIIAEKEAARMKELEEKAQRIAEEEAANTPEGKMAQKLKQKQQDEKESLELAMDMMGVSSPVPSGSGIDAMVPDSKDDFEKLQKAISEKVQSLSGSSHYNDFVEDIIKDLSLDQPAATLKKLKIHIETLHSTKLKEEKASKAKGGKGGKRSTVKMDLSKDILGGGGAGGGYDDDFDDFM